MPTGADPRVSVVLPIYGSHPGARLLPAIIGGWLAQEVSCEVIVATAGDAVQVTVGSEERRVRMLASSPVSRSSARLRNLAASAARAPMLYLGDADIVPLGRDFLTRALELAGHGAVVQPWMYRLVNASGLTPLSAWQSPGTDCFCLVMGDEHGRLRPVAGERVVYDRTGIPWIFPPPVALQPDDSPSLVRRVPFHWGGVLLGRRLFERVGQYCEGYVGWGAEDDDLLFKLTHRSTVITAWRAAPALACLHFEHRRPYAGEELVANQALLRRRIGRGADAMIRSDVQACAPAG